LIGEISALGCAFCWALSSTLTKSLSGKIEPLSLNFIRCLGAAVPLWAIIPFYPGVYGLSPITGKAVLYLSLSALVGMSVGDTIYIRGLRLINVTLAFPIAQSVTPLLTVVAAFLFLEETITRSFVGGTVLILAGIYLIAIPVGASPLSLDGPQEKRGMGIGLILIATVFWTVSIVFLKFGLKETEPIVANGIRLPVATLALLPLVFLQKSFPEGSQQIKVRLVFLGAITGILAFGLGGILFLKAVQVAGAGKTMVLTSCGPLLGLPISVFLLKEKVTKRTISGTVLVVLGIAFII